MNKTIKNILLFPAVIVAIIIMAIMAACLCKKEYGTWL